MLNTSLLCRTQPNFHHHFASSLFTQGKHETLHVRGGNLNISSKEIEITNSIFPFPTFQQHPISGSNWSMALGASSNNSLCQCSRHRCSGSAILYIYFTLGTHRALSQNASNIICQDAVYPEKNKAPSVEKKENGIPFSSLTKALFDLATSLMRLSI